LVACCCADDGVDGSGAGEQGGGVLGGGTFQRTLLRDVHGKHSTA